MRTRPMQRFAYRDRSLLVTDPVGRVTGAGSEGFYFHNTRLLSRLEWMVGDQPVPPFVMTEVGHDAMLGYAQLPEPEEVAQANVFSEVSGLHLETAYFLDGGLRLRAEVANHGPRECPMTLALRLDADFSGTAEADSGAPDGPGPVTVDWDGAGRTLRLRLDHETLDRAVLVRVEGGSEASFANGLLRLPVVVPGRGRTRVEVTVIPVLDGREHHPGPGHFTVGSTGAFVGARLGEVPPTLHTSSTTVDHAWDTALNDLASLPLGLDSGPQALIAGVPLYDQFFGRDTLTTGWQALMAVRGPLLGALRVNAAFQGTRIDDWRDEEPGAMLHQMGDAPASATGKNPYDRYFGDYATPVDYVAMLGQYYLWTGDRASCLDLLPAARRALTWLERYGDLDGDGLLEYRRRSAKGVRHQGWKDAPNAIVDGQGREVTDPIATCELQGYWHSALRQIAPVFWTAGDRVHAQRLLHQARHLRQRIDDALWWEAEGTYAVGLGPDGEPLRAVTSNAGHMLLTGVPSPERGQKVARRLMAPDMYSGWGIRTLSTQNPAYHPFSYHLGTVWPVEQASIAAGMGRYGCWPEMHRLARGFFDLAGICAGARIPEAVGGLARDDEHPHPGVYPDANAPQSWSASAVVLMVQSLLGLRPVASRGVTLLDPNLPDWLPHLELRGLRIGDARIDLDVWRQGSRTRWRAKTRSGRMHLIGVPSIRDPRARLSRAVERVVSA